MPNEKPGSELALALEELDGDREAAPLVSLLRRKTAAREEAASALDDARSLVAALEGEAAALDEGIAALEERIVALARERAAGAEAPEGGTAAEPKELERIREIHGRIEQVRSASLQGVRDVAAAQPASPIPAARLRPGFAAGTGLRTTGNSGLPLRAGAVPGRSVGVRNARGAAQRMVEQRRRQRKADDKAEE